MELLGSINDLWIKQIRLAQEHKQQVFGRAAQKAWEYFGREHDWLSDDNETDTFPTARELSKRAILPKTAEYVKVYLPYLHAKVPNRLCSPYRPQISPEILGMPPGSPVPTMPLQQADDARAWFLSWFLNFLPSRVYDLRGEARRAVIEALVKGRSCLWTEMTDGPTGAMPASFFDSVDNLLVDPDAEGGMRTAAWIARKRRRSVWTVASEFGVSADLLRSAYSSKRGQAEQEVISLTTGQEDNSDAPKNKGDVVEYWEVYSRCGAGHKFLAAGGEMKELTAQLDNIGDNVYLAVCEGLSFPLSLNPDFLASSSAGRELRDRLSWPIAFWARRKNPWPVTCLDFYPDIRGVWARSPLESALPLQQWLNDAYGFLFQKVKSTCRDIIITSEAMEESLRAALQSAYDQEIVVAKGKPGAELKDLLEILQFPPFNRDIVAMIQLAEAAFERATGMTELQYGVSGQKQIRSSAEAQIRQSNTSIRPDDMAECVEDWMSSVAEAEAGATRLHVPGAIIAPLYGEQATDPMGQRVSGPLEQAWDRLVTTDDPILAFSELNYSVEAGSGRRRNQAMQVQNANDAVQFVLPIVMPVFMQTRNPKQVNALMRMWCDAHGVDSAQFLFDPLPPPPPGIGQPGQQPGPGAPQGPPGPGTPSNGQQARPPAGQQGSPQIPPQVAAMLQQLPPQMLAALQQAPPEVLQQILSGQIPPEKIPQILQQLTGGQGPPPGPPQGMPQIPPQVAAMLQQMPPELVQQLMSGQMPMGARQ